MEEAEAGVEGGGRDDVLALEEHFVHAAGEEAEGPCGDWEERGAVQRAGHGPCELGIGDAAWGDCVDRAVQCMVFCGEEAEPCHVGGMDPWHPLFSRAESAPEGEAEDPSEDGGGSAVVAEDHARAEGDRAGGRAGFGGGGFPAVADIREEALTAWGSFREFLDAPVAVEGGPAGGDEGGGPVRAIAEAGREGAGVIDPGGADAVLAGFRPDAEERFSGEVNEGIDVCQINLRHGKPRSHFAERREWPGRAGKADEFVSARAGGRGHVAGEESGRSRDADDHGRGQEEGPRGIISD